jgi:hypothetical protein
MIAFKILRARNENVAEEKRQFFCAPGGSGYPAQAVRPLRQASNAFLSWLLQQVTSRHQFTGNQNPIKKFSARAVKISL